MATRIASILFSISLLAPITLAQATAAEAEQALRARVTAFLQYHVEGNFRKAYDMVAEDTKDTYFNMGKAQLKGFEINGVTLSDDFTKATVVATMTKTTAVMGQYIPMRVQSSTTWKIENGKWVWYDNAQNVPVPLMGIPSVIPPAGAVPPPAVASAVKSDVTGDGGLPKDLDDKAIADSARSILQQLRVDKSEVTLGTERPSEERAIFHNGMAGSVQLKLSAPEIPGFTAKLEQSTVRAASDVAVVFRYEPGDHAGRRDPIDVRLAVEPLNQTFVIRVNFAPK